jgi:hypothetical protein
MKKFKVTASFSTCCTVEIFAEDQDAAYNIAHNTDGVQFEPCGSDSWEIDRIEEVPIVLTREESAFVLTYCTSVADATREEVIAFFALGADADADEFSDKYGTGTYSSIMDAYCVWNRAMEFAKSIEKNN